MTKGTKEGQPNSQAQPVPILNGNTTHDEQQTDGSPSLPKLMVSPMAENFIRRIATRKGVKELSLYYLVSHMGEYVQLQDIARRIGCDSSAAARALDQLLADDLFTAYVEKRKFGTTWVYRAKAGEPTNLLKKMFDLVSAYYETEEQGSA